MSTPDSSEPAVVPAANPEPQYEFNEAQNEVINNLAMAMMWVRLPLIVTGVIQTLIAIGLALRLSKDGAHIVAVIGHTLAAIVCFLLASWLFKASVSFARVTTTTGRDITHLMSGLRNLASWFDLLAFFVKLYLALLAVLLGLLFVGLLTGAFKEPF
jgi:hypothetical protein